MQIAEGRVMSIARQHADEDAVLRGFACVYASTPVAAKPLPGAEVFAERNYIV
nr:hypothetical protein [uncultured Lichenicoccus sp.]